MKGIEELGEEHASIKVEGGNLTFKANSYLANSSTGEVLVDLRTNENNILGAQLKSKPCYVIKIYTKYGYFQYEVDEMASAMEHAQLIMERGVYRRSRADGAVEFHEVIKTKVEGDGLASEYLDVFKRT